MAIGVLEVDEGLVITEAHPGIEEVLGEHASLLSGHDLGRILERVVPDLDLAVVAQALQTGLPSTVDGHRVDGTAVQVRALPKASRTALLVLWSEDEHDDSSRASDARRQLDLLERVGAELSSTLEAEEAVGRLARLLVPRLADWSIVSVTDESGELRDLGYWHADEAYRSVLARYTEIRMGAVRGESFVGRALRTGEIIVEPQDATRLVGDTLLPGEATDLLHRLAPASVAVLPLRVGGEAVGIISLYSGADRAPLTDTELRAAEEIAVRAASALDNARAYALARHAQSEAEAAGRRLRVLADAGDALSGSLGAEEAVGRLAEIVVPWIADVCVVILVDEEGARIAGRAHHVPSKLPSLDGLGEQLCRALETGVPDPMWPVSAVVSSGRPATVRVDHDVASRHEDQGSEGGPGQPGAGTGSAHVTLLPLGSGGPGTGALLFINSEARGPMPERKQAVARDIARRAQLKLDNARLHAAERHVAETLQRSLLSEPVQGDGCEVAVRYVPAADTAQVGGDWYDAFVHPSGALMTVIGDVAGHDTVAAAAMGQVRGILRGVAYQGSGGPAETLGGLDRAMDGLNVGVTATAVVALLEPGRAADRSGVMRLRWSNAGHPPPVLVTADGEVTVLTSDPDLLLGVDPDLTARRESVTVLTPGSTLLLYTDGLVERRDAPIDAGIATLCEALAPLAARPVGELCDEVVSALLREHGGDDVALLAIRLTG